MATVPWSFAPRLGLQEHVDMVSTTMDQSPFRHFWLDGENVDLPEEVRAISRYERHEKSPPPAECIGRRAFYV